MPGEGFLEIALGILGHLRRDPKGKVYKYCFSSNFIKGYGYFSLYFVAYIGLAARTAYFRDSLSNASSTSAGISTWAVYMNPPLSTIIVPKLFMGETAAMRRIQLIEGISTHPLKIEVSTKLVKRKSV